MSGIKRGCQPAIRRNLSLGSRDLFTASLRKRCANAFFVEDGHYIIYSISPQFLGAPFFQGWSVQAELLGIVCLFCLYFPPFLHVFPSAFDTI